jgi:hypothetical protein
METGEPDCPLGRCFRRRPHFAHGNNPIAGAARRADPRRMYPTEVLRAHRATRPGLA